MWLARCGGGVSKHRYHLVDRLHIGEGATQDLDLCIMEITVQLGNRILDEDHAIVVFNAPADCGRNADAGRHAGHDAGVHAHIAEYCVKGCIGETAVSLLDDDVLIGPGCKLVHDLRAPCALDEEGAVAASQSRAPMRPLRIGIVPLMRGGDMDNRPCGVTKSVNKPLYLRNRSS